VHVLLALPVALTTCFFGIAGYQLMNNQNALQQGVDTQALPSAQQGRAAPDLNLQPLGQTPLLTRDALEGNGLVMVNFFASWCPPCRAEHPVLTDLAEAGVPLYGVNYRDRVDQALGFLDELGNPYDAIGRDEQARNGADWGVVAMPETFFVDETGTVVLHFRGPVTERSIRTQIRPALQAVGHDLPLLPGEEAEVN
jgi:cytochrome c biogenesis protein CcmG/thiol:disulfide interchange protein DsbE